MKKPVIGIVPLVDIQRDSYWMLPGYMLGVEAAGALPIMLPLTDRAEDIGQMIAMCDGFLFTGGQDVSPAVYGAEKLPCCGETCPARDAMEGKLLELALEADKPILGICRGIQFMNAALGGTLYQDLPTQRESAVGHAMKPPYDAAAHSVTILPGTPLHDLLGCETLGVNSYHHQAVRDLSPQLQTMALSEDGLVEAAYMPGRRFAWAVQWHPEFSYKVDAASRAIFSAFVDACR